MLIYHKISEDKVYECIDVLLQRHPQWIPDIPSIHGATDFDQDGDSDNTNLAKALPSTDHQRSKLAMNDGIGPIHHSIKVIKNLYDNKKAFQSLQEHFHDLIVKHTRSGMISVEYLSMCRIQYRFFPSLLSQHRELIGSKSNQRHIYD